MSLPTRIKEGEIVRATETNEETIRARQMKTVVDTPAAVRKHDDVVVGDARYQEGEMTTEPTMDLPTIDFGPTYDLTKADPSSRHPDTSGTITEERHQRSKSRDRSSATDISNPRTQASVPTNAQDTTEMMASVQLDSATSMENSTPCPIDLPPSQPIKVRHSTWTGFPTICFISSTVLLPLLALAVWLGCAVKKQTRVSMMGSTPIGGRFTQAQAKSIDFLCGALLAPLLMAGVNYIWFTSARTTLLNEQSANSGISLAAMVEASTTTTGTYDFPKLMALLKGSTWRLTFLAAIMLLSAVTRTLVSNVVAYESFDLPTSTHHSLQSIIPSEWDFVEWKGSLSISTLGDATAQVYRLLTDLSTKDSKHAIQADDAYIRPNISSYSFSAISQSIYTLWDVPGYQLSCSCHPATPESFLIHTSEDMTVIKASVWFDEQNDGEIKYYAGEMNSRGSPLFGGLAGTPYSFLTFDYPTRIIEDILLLDPYMPTLLLNDSYFIYARGSRVEESFSTSFGDFDSRLFLDPFEGLAPNGTRTIAVFGIRCQLFRQQGVLNYTRNNTGDWVIQGSRFEEKKDLIHPPLAGWMAELRNVLSPTSDGGLASVVSNPIPNCEGRDCVFTPLFANYLYASGEVERITWEILAPNRENDSQLFHEVRATTNVQYYRITVVPLILILGVASMVCAAAITLSMALFARRSLSSRSERMVDPLRLLADSALGLKEETDVVAVLDRKELEKWAGTCRVRYEQVVEEGKEVVRLFRVDG